MWALPRPDDTLAALHGRFGRGAGERPPRLATTRRCANVIWLVLLFRRAAVVAATALGKNDALVTFYWGTRGAPTCRSTSSCACCSRPASPDRALRSRASARADRGCRSGPANGALPGATRRRARRRCVELRSRPVTFGRALQPLAEKSGAAVRLRDPVPEHAPSWRKTKTNSPWLSHLLAGRQRRNRPARPAIGRDEQTAPARSTFRRSSPAARSAERGRAAACRPKWAARRPRRGRRAMGACSAELPARRGTPHPRAAP